MIDKKEVMIKEIDLIQACINRMAQNSFVVKGWAITLVAVVLALLPEKVEIKLLCSIGLIATACFWYLDAFFLRTERYFRWKYEWVIINRLSSDKYCFDLKPNNEKMWSLDEKGNSRKAQPIIRVMITKTLTPIYVPLLTLSIAFLLLELVKK